jgi:hypothetical protein
VGEERRHNLRLTKPKDDFVDIMANLGLPYPKKIGATWADVQARLLPQLLGALCRTRGEKSRAEQEATSKRGHAALADEAVPANMVCGIQTT